MSKLVDFYVSNDWPRERHMTHNKEASMTRQEFKEECDINTLMAKFDEHVHGGPNGLMSMDPAAMYVDLTEMPRDLMEYHEYMFRAENAFMSLPAVVRKEFDNSAHAFAEFAADPENLSQMRTWGLAAPEPQETPPMKVEVVTPKVPPSAPAPGGTTPVAQPPASTHGST